MQLKTVEDAISVLTENSYVYCVVGGFVRKMRLSDYRKTWHQFDALLRRFILMKQLNFKGAYSKEKLYAGKLLKDFGYDINNGDQAFVNTLGLEIEFYKPLVARRDKKTNFHIFVETLFFKNLCKFDKRKGAVAEAKGVLRIDYKLFAFMAEARELFKRDVARDERQGRLIAQAFVNAAERRALAVSSA